MAKKEFAKPFDGAISRFAEKDAPKAVRQALDGAGKNDILDPTYPYRDRLERSAYEDEFDACQLELIRAQRWIRSEGKRVVVLFEGRDAAGKGGTIKAIRENLSPRAARTVALSAPSETERGQWYFQRYAQHLPTRGEMVLYDRSWYNRAVVEKVFGWVDDADRERFFAQLPEFEDMLVKDGIILIKLWLAIGRAEQLRQFLQRESDPLKQWKLSRGRRRRPVEMGRLFRSHLRHVRPKPHARPALDRHPLRRQAPGPRRGDARRPGPARLSRQGGAAAGSRHLRRSGDHPRGPGRLSRPCARTGPPPSPGPERREAE